MSIPAIPPIPSGGITPGFASPFMWGTTAALPTDGIDSVQAAAATPAPAHVDGFGSMLTEKLDELNHLHATSDQLAMRAVTGDLTDIHEYTVAANQAAVATQLTVAVRDKAVQAFTEIMRMQL